MTPKQVIDAFYNLKTRNDVLKENLIGEAEDYKDKKGKHDELVHKLEVQKQAVEVMKQLVQALSEEGLLKLQQLLTYGLSLIFDDRSYSIEIDIKDRGTSKTVEFFLVEGSLKASLRDSVGGGIQSVVSLVLRVYFLLHMDLRRFLVLDESLSQVSTKYVPGLFSFLDHLVEDLGFEILFITHDPRFLPYAKRVYRVYRGSVKL